MENRGTEDSRVSVTEVGIGTWELSGDVWGKKDDRQSKQAVTAGLERGATYIDTAAGYGGGHVESLLGEMIDSGDIDRRAVQISTKVIPKNSVFAPSPHVPIAEAYPKEWIIDETRRSLERLRADYIDILFMHTWSRAWAQEDAWLEAVEQLKGEGLIKAVGISVPDERPDDANTFIAGGAIDAVQVVFNVFQQEPIWTVLPLAEKKDVAVIARSPFSSGVLVQSWSPNMQFPEGDWRGLWPESVKPGWLDSQCRMAALAKPVLERSGLSFPQAALRFVLDFPVTSVIPGSANPDHVAENMGASGLAPLSEEIHAELQALWLGGDVVGTYNGSV